MSVDKQNNNNKIEELTQQFGNLETPTQIAMREMGEIREAAIQTMGGSPTMRAAAQLLGGACDGIDPTKSAQIVPIPRPQTKASRVSVKLTSPALRRRETSSENFVGEF